MVGVIWSDITVKMRGLERMVWMRGSDGMIRTRWGWKEWLGPDGVGKNGWDEKGLERMAGTRWGWKEWLG
jgi:hypothetical protein